VLAPRLHVYVTSHWSVGLEYLLYHRRGIYTELPDRELKNNEQRLEIGYLF